MGSAAVETPAPRTTPKAPGAAAAVAAEDVKAPTLSTRYRVSKERSAELLRLALAQMGRHPAAFNPLTFTLWYEHVSGINPGLTRAVEKHISDNLPLDDVAIASLYRDHVAPADDEAMATIGVEMQRLMAGMATSASAAGAQAGQYGHQLDSLSKALGTKDEARLRAQLADVAAGTAQMQASVAELKTKLVTSRDEIDRLRADLERARTEALTDGLTGILNRKGLDQRLNELVAGVKSPNEQHCIVILDIDHFKRVNDTFGHLAGDRVIQGLGTVLKDSLSRERQVAARYGGEEFALLLPNTSLAEGVAFAESVRARVKSLRIRDRSTKEQLLSVTISAGVAQLAPGEAGPSFVARADAALYQSKQNGRDRVSRAT